LDDRYRGVFGRRDIVFAHAADLAALNLEHGSLVDIETALPGGNTLRLTALTVVEYDIARGSLATYYPEANVLVPLGWHDMHSGTPSYKSVPVRMVPSVPRDDKLEQQHVDDLLDAALEATFPASDPVAIGSV
jgi:anaerobic selenocysteine-containing dehydrogenase